MKINNKLGWDSFLQLCLHAKDVKTLSSLFDTFLTSEEKENLALRYLIVDELIKNKKTQRQIAKDLNVSIAKITRGSKLLKKISPEYSELLQNQFKLPKAKK